ncbi:MAG: 50S ribosomal protein L25/general stress protein Ctc [Arachnia sp.]
MSDLNPSAVPRTVFGKGASRRLRRSGLEPAVVYGHGTDPVHISLPAKETFLALRTSNALLEIAIEGTKKPIMALPKQVQRDPLTGGLDHVDLLIVREGEKVTVDVWLEFVGEAARDGMVNTDLTALTVEAPATNIPANIQVSIEGMQIGDHLTVADLALPEGVETQIDPETLVVNVVPPPSVSLESEEADGEPEVVGAAGGDSAE